MVAYETARNNFIDSHIQTIRRVYSQRRDVMLRAMEEHFPEGVNWTRPGGGLFLWVMLPEEIDTTELLKTAIEHKVAFVPGQSFHPHGDGKNTMRLNFSYCKPELINEGIKRLGDVLRIALEAGTAKAEEYQPVVW
jgi:2-aminoadipate transaminase